MVEVPQLHALLCSLRSPRFHLLTTDLGIAHTGHSLRSAALFVDIHTQVITRTSMRGCKSLGVVHQSMLLCQNSVKWLQVSGFHKGIRFNSVPKKRSLLLCSGLCTLALCVPLESTLVDILSVFSALCDSLGVFFKTSREPPTTGLFSDRPFVESLRRCIPRSRSLMYYR